MKSFLVFLSLIILIPFHAKSTVTSSFTTTSLNYCTGDIIDFTNTSTGAVNNIWQLEGFTFETTVDAVLSFGSEGSYSVSLIVNDGGICADTTVVILVIDQAADAGADNSDIFCNVNDSIDLNDLLDGDLGGLWTETTTSGQFNSTSGFLDYHELPEDVYFFEYVVLGTGACPNDTALIDIEVNQEPSLSFEFSNVNIPTSDSLFVDFTLSGVNSGATYIWSFCDGSLTANNSPFHFNWTNPGTFCVCVQLNNSNGCVETFCDSTIVIFDDAGFGTDSVFDFKLYPNPAIDLVNIDFDNQGDQVLIELFDLNSRLILSESTFNNHHPISVSDLESGLYIVSVTSKEGNRRQSLIVR